MACYHPRQGWLVTRAADGKKRLKFTKPTPPYYGDKVIPQTISCGQCVGCRLNYAKSWAIRCTHEAKMHDENSYITLTYNNENLPKNNTLVKAHFQKFMRRMRKHPAIPKIRFFMCGEYGKATKKNGYIARPHYHAIIFGYEFKDKVPEKQNKQGDILYSSKLLEEIWGKGFVTIGEVNFKTTAYVARYVTKKVTGDKAEQHYKRLDPETGELVSIIPEYTTMSLKPGIGQTWFEAYGTDVYPSDQVIMNRKELQPPRYYDKLLESQSPATLELVKHTRQLNQKLMNKLDQTKERLEVREKVTLNRLKQLKRDL